MRPSAILLLACAAAVTALPAVGSAAWPHERQGIVLGLGAGGGSGESGDVIYEQGTYDLVISAHRETGRVLGLRAGWAFRNRWALGLEGTVWSRRIDRQS